MSHGVARSAPPLVVRFGAFGDTVQLTSSLQALAALRGGPCDVLTAHGWGQRILADQPFVGEIRSLSSRRTPYWLSPEQHRVVRWLRERGTGPVWLIEPRDRAADKTLWLLRRGGVPRDRIVDGRDLDRGLLEHTLDFQLRVVSTSPPTDPEGPKPSGEMTPEPPPPRLGLSGAEKAEAEGWLRDRGWRGEPLIVLQTQSRRRNRGRWPDASWVSTIRAMLDEESDARILLPGAPHEARAIEALAKAVGDPRVWPAATDLPVRRLFGVLARSRSCVSLDSGPAHAAATLGCPVVVLLGMADPRRCRPVSCGAEVRLVASIPPDAWPDDPFAWQRLNRLESIPVDEVLSAWRSLDAPPEPEVSR